MDDEYVYRNIHKNNDGRILTIINIPIELWTYSILKQVDSNDSWLITEMLRMTCHHFKNIRKRDVGVELKWMLAFRRKDPLFGIIGMPIERYHNRSVNAYHESVTYIAAHKGYRGILDYALRRDYRIPPHVFSEVVKHSDINLMKVLHIHGVSWEICVAKYAIGNNHVSLDILVWLYNNQYIQSNDWFLLERMWVSYKLAGSSSCHYYTIRQDLLDTEIPIFWIPSDPLSSPIQSLHSIIIMMVMEGNRKIDPEGSGYSCSVS